MHGTSAGVPKVAAYGVALLRKLRSRMLGFDPQAKLFLFGSRARGDNRYDSDYDLLVVSELFSGQEPLERWRWFFRHILIDQENYAIEPRLFTPSEWKAMHGTLFYSQVTRDALPLERL